MKFLASQMMATLAQPQMRQNVGALARFLGLLGVVILVYSVIFHFLMLYEGQDHSLLTGLYWTLTVMSTLGFGDITFHSDLGRLFSLVVLVTGIVMLLIVLPFAFIRYFYAPWLEAQIKVTAPRRLDAWVRGHVVLCAYDDLSRALIPRLRQMGVPYVVLEADPAVALGMVGDGIQVVTGDVTDPATYVSVQSAQARLVVTNLSDPRNTNVTLTVREHAPEVPILAFLDDQDAVDLLELAGATAAEPIKHRLGEQLAARAGTGRPGVQIVGWIRGLAIAELAVRHTPYAGATIRDTKMREETGVSVVAYWDQGELLPSHPDVELPEDAVAVVVGTRAQLDELDRRLPEGPPIEHPVLIIGGGKVGRAAARALRRRGVPVTILERDPTLRSYLETVADQVVIGAGEQLEVIQRAGIADAPSVLLTTHDDDVNIYLTIYCRRLNPKARILSRISYDQDVAAIRRAGADFVLSQTQLGVQIATSLLLDRPMVVVGEGCDLFLEPVPPSLVGKTLAESGIGARTGFNVIAVEAGEEVLNAPPADHRLEKGTDLVLLGTTSQLDRFREVFGP